MSSIFQNIKDLSFESKLFISLFIIIIIVGGIRLYLIKNYIYHMSKVKSDNKNTFTYYNYILIILFIIILLTPFFY